MVQAGQFFENSYDMPSGPGDEPELFDWMMAWMSLFRTGSILKGTRGWGKSGNQVRLASSTGVAVEYFCPKYLSASSFVNVGSVGSDPYCPFATFFEQSQKFCLNNFSWCETVFILSLALLLLSNLLCVLSAS